MNKTTCLALTLATGHRGVDERKEDAAQGERWSRVSSLELTPGMLSLFWCCFVEQTMGQLAFITSMSGIFTSPGMKLQSLRWWMQLCRQILHLVDNDESMRELGGATEPGLSF